MEVSYTNERAKSLVFLGISFGDFKPAETIEVVCEPFEPGECWCVLQELAYNISNERILNMDNYLANKNPGEVIIDIESAKAQWAIEAVEGKHELGFLEWKRLYYANPIAIFEIR
jgi:hypothetical protein